MNLIKNALCLYLELCFLCRRGAHFQKTHGKKLSESEKWSQKTLDGKCDGYRWGLGGAKKRKCWFLFGFNNVFLRCQEGLEDANRANRQASRAVSMPKKCYFWLTMLCVYIWKYASHCSGKHFFRKILKQCSRKVKNGARITSDTSKYHQHGVGYMKMASKLCRIYQ